MAREREHVSAKNDFFRFVSFRFVASFVVLPTCVRGGDSTFAFAYRTENIDLVVITYGVVGASNCERTLRVHVHLTSEKGRRGMNRDCSWANWRNTCVFAVFCQSVDECAFSQSAEEAKVAQRQ